jgi:hypothetical protein
MAVTAAARHGHAAPPDMRAASRPPLPAVGLGETVPGARRPFRTPATPGEAAGTTAAARPARDECKQP